MRTITFRLWTLTLASALLQLLPFPLAGPVPPWRRLFCWVCLTPLLVALLDEKDRITTKQAALLAYGCGVVWYLGNCYWIYQTMHFYGRIPQAASFGILLLFSLYLGLYHALFGALLRGVFLRWGRATSLCIAPALWVSVELARARITGFPWDLLGYTQIDSALLTKLAPLTGVMGLSFAIATVNALWLWRGAAKTRLVSAVIATLSVVSCALPVRSAIEKTSATAVLLQENLSVGGEASTSAETKEQMIASFEKLSTSPGIRDRTALQNAQVVIWPEAPTDFFDVDPNFRAALGVVARKTGAPVIADSVSPAPVDAHGQPHFYNTASFFSANGEHIGSYDKMHLVPFGEYTPYKELFFFAGHLLDNVGPFVPGNVRQLFATGGHRYGVFICYESIFGDEVREFARTGADVLVNISDDGWYGDTSAPWEHLDMARMRAIENARWVLRSTNTGVTAIIDPHGRLSSQLPRHVRTSLAAGFNYRDDLTFYTQHGDWFAWLCAVVSAGMLLIGLSRRVAVN